METNENNEAINEENPKNASDSNSDVKFIDDILEWIESFVFASFIVLLIFIFMFRTVVVDGSSMNPTLYDSQRLILTHFNYTPERGDIIVANSPGLNKTIIKRCIGVAGDDVLIDYATNSITVNGEKINEYYLDPQKPMELKSHFNEDYRTSETQFEYIVPDGKVFALGDNRNESNDSRSADVGFIDLDDILGRAIFRFYTADSPGTVGRLK